MHASQPVRVLKFQNSGSHTIVWMHENTTHTDRMGSAALVAAVPYTGKVRSTRQKKQGL